MRERLIVAMHEHEHVQVFFDGTTVGGPVLAVTEKVVVIGTRSGSPYQVDTTVALSAVTAVRMERS